MIPFLALTCVIHASSSVFPGSSFNNLSTSFNCCYVLLICPLTPFRAVCNLVVSPPISTVIPMILLATADTSFRKNGHKKSPDFSRHEKSTNHFRLMLSNYFVFVNLFNCVSTSRPPYITRIIVTTCVSSSGIYRTR